MRILEVRCLIVVMPVIPPPLLMEIAFTICLDGSSREERCVSIFFTPTKNLQATRDKGNKKQMDIVVRKNVRIFPFYSQNPKVHREV